MIAITFGWRFLMVIYENENIQWLKLISIPFKSVTNSKCSSFDVPKSTYDAKCLYRYIFDSLQSK